MLKKLLEMEKQNVALVLSGGGARGMAHIGIIEELLKKGFRITSIAGTSIGSLIAGVYASGKLTEFKNWVLQIGKYDIFKLMDFAISKRGFIKGEKVFTKLHDFLLDTDIENLKIPYAAVAVDIKNHQEIIFRKGNLIEAIRASVSIPTVLLPQNCNGIDLVDGGVLNPLPLDCITRTSDDFVVAIDLNSCISYQKPKLPDLPNIHETTYLRAKQLINDKWSEFHKENHRSIGYFDLITESIYTMQMKLTQFSIEKYKPDVLIEISREACEIFGFHRSEEMIEYGRKQFKANFARLKDIK
jgi:NTE family protein